MKVELIGWNSKGLRCPDFSFDFLNNNSVVYPITFIQMPNGTGKTTTLDCLRACLTGEARSWSETKILEYRSKSKDVDKGTFETKLRYNGKLLTFTLEFLFHKHEVRYYTTVGHGRKSMHEPPSELNRFLKPPFVSLLLFNGELPGDLLDSKKTKAQEALDSFFQLYLFDEIESSLTDLWNAKTSKASAKGEKGLTQRHNEVTKCSNEVFKLQETLRKSKEELEILQAEIDLLRKDINDFINSNKIASEKKKMQEKELSEAEIKLNVSINNLMTQVRLPHRVCNRFRKTLINMKDSLDKLKLPENTSKQFFIELSEEPVCICGRPLDDKTRNTVLERASLYMGTDTSGTINSLKSDITSYVLSDNNQVDVSELVIQCKKLAHERDMVKTSLEIQKKLIIEKGGKEIQQKEMYHKEKEKHEMELQEAIDIILAEPQTVEEYEKEMTLKYWKDELISAKQKLAEITGTIQLKRQIELLNNILKNAKKLSTDRIVDAVTKDMNESITCLLDGHNIKVSKIGDSLVLEGQTGASVGQTLAVGYSFLTTLFGRGQHQFPFVVDAPVIALDTRVRSEVARVIPKVCNQFVTFILDTERDGFVNEIEKTCKGDIQYITAFRNAPHNSHLMGLLPSKNVEKSNDGVQVFDKGYFYDVSFPPDSEEPE